MSSNARRLVKGSALRMAEFFTVGIVGLVLMPFIIHSLGDKMYGLWIFVGTFLGYYGLMDFGLSSAIQRFLSRSIGVSNNEEANKVINTSLCIFTILGFVTLIFSFIIAFISPLLIKNITDVALFRKIILILGLNFAIGFPLRVFSGILTANLRYDLNTGLELIKLVFRTILIIVLLKAGHGIMALTLITFFADISGYIARYFVVRHLYKYIVFSRVLIDKSLIKPLFGYSIYTFISDIADLFRFNLDNLVITIFIGLNSVTLYSIASSLVRRFIDFAFSAIGMFTPIFSQYEARGDYDSIREKFIFTTKISSYLSILIGGIIIMFGKPFIQRWVGEQYLDAYPILIVLIIPTIFALMQIPTVQLLFGISKHKFFALSNSLEGVANLVLSIVLVRRYGLMGVALGTAIPMVIIKLFVQPVYTCRIIKLDIRKYYFEVLATALFKASTVLLVFWFLIKSFIFPDYFNLAVFIVMAILLFVVYIFYLGFENHERSYFKKVVFNSIFKTNE